MGTDGRTAFERMIGRLCNIPAEKFGEQVWYKGLKTKAKLIDKLETEWDEGLRRGEARSSKELLIGTREKVVRARAVGMKPTWQQRDAS